METCGCILRALCGSLARSLYRRDLGIDYGQSFHVERAFVSGRVGRSFAATDLRTRMNSIWLAADDPDKARAEVIEALKAWPHEGFHLQHYSSLLAQAQIELYTGDADVAWKHIAGQWPALENSMLLRTRVLRIEATYLRARAELATALTSDNSAKLSFAEK